MMLVSTISYIDRNTLALLAPTILRDTHLSNEQYGFIISAFSVAYMLGNPFGAPSSTASASAGA
jgi:ACS family hexuronate transporter-like MFS transporter